METKGTMGTFPLLRPTPRRPTYEVDVDSPIAKSAAVIASLFFSLLFVFGGIYLSP